ncbi:MAG: glycosyltransferase family 61 protein [Pelagibacterales bacterium]|nr:glycosyltransferase family 61 protein [Pelagibacterales bacterium]
MKNIFSPLTIYYKKPLNFKENNSQFKIFENLIPDNYFEPKLYLLKNVRVATNSVVFNYFKIYRESCINITNYNLYKKGYKFFIKFIFPKINFSKKRFILITDEWTSNYYHWHIFALSKLLILQEKNFTDNSLLVLPKKYKKYKFVLPTLEKMGISREKIVFLPRKSNIKVKELALIETSQQNPIAFNKLREVLTRNIKKTNFDFGEKIYISRQNQVLRFVENEEELTEILEKYGFKKVVIDNFSYDEQIAISAKAKYLISPHEAGLTNILFMKENSYLLEMATKPHDNKLLTDYYKLSSILNINYLYQECEVGENSKVKDFHHGSLVVDLKKLEENLNLMFEHGNNHSK